MANADLSSVTSSTDHLVLVHGDNGEWATLLEFVSSSQQGLIEDIQVRQALAQSLYKCPVEVLLVFMHKRANQPKLTGTYAVGRPGHPPTSVMNYKVIRVWQLSINQLLNESPAIMPLAVLSSEYNTQEQAKELLACLFDKLNEALPEQPEALKNLWASTEILLGLKFQGPDYKQWIKELTRGKLAVRESIIYQDILQEGREEGRRDAILKFCGKRFGKPNEGERIALEAITDLDRLDRLIEQMDQVTSWYNLVQIP